MLLHRIKNPRTIYNGMNAAVTYDEDGAAETRWGMAWCEDGAEVRVEWSDEGYAPYHAVEDFSPEAESWIEVDLHDPVTALQILLRYREVFPSLWMQTAESSVASGLLYTTQSALERRATALNALLTRLDAVPEVKEVSDADPS